MRVLGTCHGHGAPVVLEPVIGLVVDRHLSKFLFHIRGKASPLNHEVGNDTMEDRAVVVPPSGITQEIIDRLRGLIRVKLKDNGTL